MAKKEVVTKTVNLHLRVVIEIHSEVENIGDEDAVMLEVEETDRVLKSATILLPNEEIEIKKYLVPRHIEALLYAEK